MRTLVDIPDDSLEELDIISDQAGISRAEAIRRAIDDFKEKYRKIDLKAAKGIWKDREIDGLDFQADLRREWEDD